GSEPLCTELSTESVDTLGKANKHADFTYNCHLHYIRNGILLELTQAAGWPIWLLVATSVITLAIIIERFLALRSARIMPSGLPEQVLELMRRQQDEPDTSLRLARGSPMGRILAEVAAQRHQDDAWRLAAIESVGRDVSFRLNRYLPALATISVIA